MDEPPGEPGLRAADELLRALAGLDTAGRRWRDDLATTCAGADPAFAEALRRWREQLTALKLAVHRVERRLLDLVLLPGAEAWAAPAPGSPDAIPDWRVAIAGWCDQCRLPTVYLRVERVLELDGEAVPADVITDLAGVAGVVDATAPAVREAVRSRTPRSLPDATFYRILGPWRRTGLPALAAGLRWIDESLDDHEDW